MNDKDRYQAFLEWRTRMNSVEDVGSICPTTVGKVADLTLQVFEQMSRLSDEEHVLYPVLALSVLKTLKEVLVDPNIWVYPCCDEEGLPILFEKVDRAEAFHLRVPPAFDLQCIEFAETEHYHGYSCKNSIHYEDLEKFRDKVGDDV